MYSATRLVSHSNSQLSVQDHPDSEGVKHKISSNLQVYSTCKHYINWAIFACFQLEILNLPISPFKISAKPKQKLYCWKKIAQLHQPLFSMFVGYSTIAAVSGMDCMLFHNIGNKIFTKHRKHPYPTIQSGSRRTMWWPNVLLTCKLNDVLIANNSRLTSLNR